MAHYQAMILAAGLGKRMREHNSELPKPLVPVAGRPLISYALKLLENAGIGGAVVNTHYKAEQIEAYLAGQNLETVISQEEELLETGGGIVKALPLLAERFFVINSDVINLESSPDASLLKAMQDGWDEARMAGLLLLVPVTQAVGYRGVGDFILAEDGSLRPYEAGKPAYVFSGVQLLHRRFLAHAPEGKFSLSPLYREAIAQRPCRLFGMVHPGAWFHVGDGEGVREAEASGLL